MKFLPCPYNACGKLIPIPVDDGPVRLACAICPECGQRIIHNTCAVDPQPITLGGYEQQHGSWDGPPCVRVTTIEEGLRRQREMEARSMQKSGAPPPEPKPPEPGEELDFSMDNDNDFKPG